MKFSLIGTKQLLLIFFINPLFSSLQFIKLSSIHSFGTNNSCVALSDEQTNMDNLTLIGTFLTLEILISQGLRVGYDWDVGWIEFVWDYSVE